MTAGYYHTNASVKEYISLAKDVSAEGLIQKLKDVLPSGATVLEIGSGPGTDWKLLSEDYSVVGSDYSAEFLNHLKVSYPTGRFLQLNAATLVIDEHFDGIYANKVMHHLKDEELAASIQRQHELLNNGGIICLSFWKGEGTEVFKGLFVNYHTEEALKALFKRSFELLLLESYAEFEAGDSLLLIARKI